MSKKLSILICSLDERKDSLNRLLSILNHQLNDAVELIIESDSISNPMTVGRKRNILLTKASGDYVCFIDDDDTVSEDYVSKILQATQSGPDCCGIQGRISFAGHNPRLFIHSLQYKNWFEKNSIYYRCPNHLNPIKRNIALEVMFPEEKSFGEDKDFSLSVLPRLKSEVFIPGVIYNYLYNKPLAINNKPKEKFIHPKLRIRKNR